MTSRKVTAELIDSDNRVYPLINGTIVGSSLDCDLRIGTADSTIAPLHAIFRLEDRLLTICNLSASDSTSLNHTPIKGFTELKSGDVLQLGDSTFTIKISYPKSWRELPGAWFLEEAGKGTILLDASKTYQSNYFPTSAARVSDVPHIIHMKILPDTQTIEGEWFPLENDTTGDGKAWEIGRDPSYCQICVPEDAYLSDRHAQLYQIDGRWRIVKLISKNPVYVNGKKHLTKFLDDGDVITVGRTCLTFYSFNRASVAST